jgi:hypothetical protein
MKMKNWNGYVLWGLLCLLTEACVATISGAEALHSNEYNGQSIVVAALITTGVLLIISLIIVVCWIFDNND